MRKIYSIFLATTAAMLFAPAVNAQLPYPDKGAYSIANTIYDKTSVTDYPLIFPHDAGLQQPENLGVAYSKNVSSPFSDGTYWIKLESFATGQSSFIETAAPADIILVLDLSTSMRNTRNRYSYVEATVPSDGWTPHTINAGTYYILYEGEHYKLSRGGNNNNNRNVYFNLEDGTTCYLVNGNVQVGGTAPSVSNNTVVYSGTLYTLNSSSETRFAALQRATKDFIDVIEKNDKYEDEAGTVERTGGRLGNRISIITFNSSATTQNTLANGELKDAAGSTPSTAEQLKTLVDNLKITVQGTTPYNGFVNANAQLATISAARMLTATRTVVLFTDGEPYDSGDRWKAIGEALKTKTKDNPNTPNVVEGYDAKVFTVGMFTTAPTETGSNANIWKFMNYVSSNAPNAQNLNTPGDNFNKNAGYYYDVSDESMDLSAVFREIAHQSSGTTSSLNAGSRNVDVVSNSFVLPAGTTTDNIDGVVKVYTARLTGKNGSKYEFEEEILKGHTPDTEDYEYDVLDADGNSTGVRKKVDEDLNISFNAATNAITVTGFDYNSNFCGPVENQQGQFDHYQGFKVIIMIPVKMNPNSVGGPNVETNGPGSGIFVNADSQTAYVPFKSPTVSLPVNIHIKKIGLYPGESAKFKIYRAVIPNMTDEQMKTWNPASLSEGAWSEVSTVFVTNSTNDPNATPMVKVRGLPATIAQDSNNDGVPDKDTDGNVIQLNVVYRIKEENWGWSYTVSNTLDYPNPQYTVTSNVVNPFQFKNTKKNPERIDIEIRHAETKATNIFKTGETNGHYVDSKARD